MIYFLLNIELNAVTIGKTHDLRGRFRTHDRASPVPLVFLGSILGYTTEERRIHRDLSVYRMPNRREWFSATPDVMNYIGRLLRPIRTLLELYNEREDDGEIIEHLAGCPALILPEDRRAEIHDAVVADGDLWIVFDDLDGRRSYLAKDCVLLCNWPETRCVP